MKNYRAKRFGEEEYVYGWEYYAYIDKGGHNQCFLYAGSYLEPDSTIPIDEWTLQAFDGKKWIDRKHLEVEIW
jgi:hypothetical protein